jgi:orotate phosphoribosyltransferase
VLVVDDVITAGTAIREVLDIVAAQGARTVGVVVGLDRRERGLGRYSAIQELEQEKGISVTSIVDINDVMAYIRSLDTEREVLTRMEAYQARYGV